MKELLGNLDFFSGLDDKILKKLADAAVLREYAKDEVIVRQGEMGLGMYIISRGRVKIEREQDGNRVKIAELGPGEAFAEMAILDNQPRSANVIAAVDTECLLLTRDTFVRLMNKHPEIPIRAARALAERLREANAKIVAVPPTVAETPPASPAGSSPAPTAVTVPESPLGAKARIQETLLQTFQSLYLMKALTRFSVAVIGCPVEGAASNLVEEVRIGDVKALVFPAAEPVELNLSAQQAGSFTLHVFTPNRAVPACYGPVAVRPQDRFQLLLDSACLVLRHGDEWIPESHVPFQTQKTVGEHCALRPGLDL